MPVAPPEINAILPASRPVMVRSFFFSETVSYSRTASGFEPTPIDTCRAHGLPLWVISRHNGPFASCPLYPR